MCLLGQSHNTDTFVTTVSTGIGRPIIGLLGDRFGTIRVTTIGTFFSALFTFFIWIFGGKSYGGLMVYGLLGMFPSIMWATFAVMASSVFDLQTMNAGMCKQAPLNQHC
jgi:nitrate/nitrite transporter NarK